MYQQSKMVSIAFVAIISATIPWAEPRDLSFEEYFAWVSNPAHQPRDHGFLVAMTDGTVRWLRPELPKERLRALFTIDGGEAADPSVFLDHP